MKRIFFIFIFVSCASLRAQAAATDPAGGYSIVRGIDTNNGEYTGQVTIKNKGHGLYRVTWVVQNVEFHGVGFVGDGELDVAYSNDPFIGLVVYKVNAGNLSGERISSETKSEFGYEDLQGLPGLEGIHMIIDAQASDGGDKYSGMVEIHAYGDVYNLSWFANGANYDGIGILEGDRLIVGWGAEVGSQVGVMRYMIKDNELQGRWAMAGFDRTGIENLVRTSPSAKAVNSDITIEGLTRNIEKALGQINDMTHDYALRFRPKNGSVPENKDLIVATMYYKKPNLVKEDSTALYLTTGPRKSSYIIKLEGQNFNTYELLDDGSVKKNSYPADGWETSGYTPGSIYADIRKRIKEGATFTIDHRTDYTHYYLLRFDSPDEAEFEISDETWIPYARTVYDQEQGALVQTEWSNIKINSGIPDEMFVVPQKTNVHN